MRSGFDRDHLTPNAAVADLYGRDAQLETFLLSNVCPQAPHLNRGIWERLERVAATDYARRYGEVWIMCGPIFGDAPAHLESEPPVPIPTAFWKVVVAPHGPRGPPAALGFIMGQDTPEGDALEHHLAPVAEIEAAAGPDLFPALPSDQAAVLRAPAPAQPW